MHDRSHNRVSRPLENDHYDHDIHYTLQMCQWVLKPIGMWSFLYGRTSKREQFVSVVLLVVCYAVLCFILIPSGHYIIYEERDLYTKVKLMGPVSYCMFTTIKYSYFGLKGSTFERCFDHVENDWRTVKNPHHRSIMLKQSALSRHLITLCAVFLYTGGMSYHTVLQFLSKDRILKNTTLKPLAYPGYDAFLDTQSSPVYEILFTIQCCCAMIMFGVTTAAYSLAAIFVTHICGQIQIQIARLDDMVERLHDKDNQYDPLAIIIRDHVDVLRFSKDVESALSEIFLMEILESTLIICLLEYYCLMEWKKSDTVAIITYVILLTSVTFNVLIFCYIGEILSEKCSAIGPASYTIEWYNLTAKKSYDLILLSAISLYPPKLTAGKIFDLSLSTFTSVLKTSLAYFNLLRTMTTM